MTSSPPPHYALAVCWQRRSPHLDRHAERDPPSLEELLSLLPPPAGCRSLTLFGGEPLLRPDLPQLLDALRDYPSLALQTDGLGLGSPARLQQLRRSGVKRLVFELHSARAQAQGWLCGHPQALREALRALRAAQRGGFRC